MSDYKITDYGVFSNAVATTKSFGTNISAVQDAINAAKTTLSNTSIFEGPVQANCISKLDSINTDFASILSNYQAIESFLTGTSSNYQAGDAQSSDTVLSETAKGTTDAQTANSGSINVTNTKMSIPSDPTIASKKQQWLKDVDDKSQYTYYQGNNLYSRTNKLEVFDNATGQIIKGDGGEITMKPGETRILTVKLPTDTGAINQITRVTADGNEGYRAGNIVTARSDIDPDPNNIEWVRLVETDTPHKPSDMSLLHNNSYDWIITAKADGTVTASQTCLWSTDMTKGRNLKAMIDLKVHVQS